MANKTSDDIWAIFCKVYSLKSENPKSSLQEELLTKISAYVDSIAEIKNKEKSCWKK